MVSFGIMYSLQFHILYVRDVVDSGVSTSECVSLSSLSFYRSEVFA